MSKLIERTEMMHVNVKEQDGWEVVRGYLDKDTATLSVHLNPQNAGCVAGGVLYLNGISFEKLEELKAEIDQFIEEWKPVRASQEARQKQR